MAPDDAPSAGLTLRGSVDGARAAGTSARSAVAVHHGSHDDDSAIASRPGHPGRRRSARLLPERARFLPDLNQIPAPSVLTESQQTSCSASRWEGLPCPRPGSPPSGTPSADTENKAQRSAQVGEQDPADRPLPEGTRLLSLSRGPALGYFRCSSTPPPRAVGSRI